MKMLCFHVFFFFVWMLCYSRLGLWIKWWPGPVSLSRKDVSWRNPRIKNNLGVNFIGD